MPPPLFVASFDRNDSVALHRDADGKKGRATTDRAIVFPAVRSGDALVEELGLDAMGP